MLDAMVSLRWTHGARIGTLRRMLSRPTALAIVLATACALGCGRSTRSAGDAGATPHASIVEPDSVVVLPGLSASARIVTDRNGVPHLSAATLDDLYYVWGFVTARDRLWQIAHARQSARGELWRWIGNRALQGDGGAQLFELRTRAEWIWSRERRRPEVRMPLERYAAGVNAWLDLCRSGARPWPAEFQALGVTPDDWLPEDAILMLLAQGFVLDFALPEIGEAGEMRAHGADWPAARERFEIPLMRTTIPDSVAAGRPALAYGDAAADEVFGRSRTTATPRLRGALARLELATHSPDEQASNIFAVGPARSASGRPLLANDPHLPLSDPNPLEVVHVEVPGIVNAVGAVVPGLPFIVSGRNRACAWGLTALSADVMDVYADTLSKDGKHVRVAGGGWTELVVAPFDMRFNVLGWFSIPVPGQMRRYGPHGPIVSLDRKHGLALSIRWAGNDSAVTLGGLLGLERSATAAEISSRVRTVVTPSMNIVAADVGGAVVYQTVGAVPRRGFPPLRGPLPADGRHEWRGLIPPEEMPAWNVPTNGFVVNANNLPIAEGHPDDWPRFEWAHDRAARMQDRLAALPRATLADLESIQNDTYSLDAARLLPRLLRAVEPLAPRLADDERAALALLAGWDYQVRRDRVAPTLYWAWVGALQRRSKLGGLNGLAAAALDGLAPDALHHPVTERQETPGDAAVAALRIGLARVRARFDRDPSQWTWGAAHRARFAHALAWKDKRFERPAEPFDGDRSTPSVGRSRMPWSVTGTHAPVFRHLVDLAVPDSSRAILPPGNSGVRGAPHAGDLLEAWADHRYVTLHLDSVGVASMAESETRLVPGR